MSILPRLSGRAVVKAFRRADWELARQNGSHVVLVTDSSWATLSVPDHRDHRLEKDARKVSSARTRELKRFSHAYRLPLGQISQEEEVNSKA